MRYIVTALIGLGAIGYAQDARTVQMNAIRNTPFIAQAITESVRNLADGSHVTHKNTARIARDSEGRTRREQLTPGGSAIVFIQDPVAGYAYAVDPNRKSVRRFVVNSAEDSQAPTNDGQPLGLQMIEGVQAEGTRITRALAAGDAGSEHPLQIVIEAWYSSELQTIVMRKTTDPRIGETTYRLSNIELTEPDHALFVIPLDYSISDEQVNRMLSRSGNR